MATKSRTSHHVGDGPLPGHQFGSEAERGASIPGTQHIAFGRLDRSSPGKLKGRYSSGPYFFLASNPAEAGAKFGLMKLALAMTDESQQDEDS
jgi:hypothetical protein